MAYPTVAAEGGGGGTSTTAPTITLPAGINSGQVLVIWLAASSITTTTMDTSGWTQVANDSNSRVRGPVIFKKLADGTEDGAVLAFTFGTASGYKWRYFVFDGADVARVHLSTAATGTSTAPDAPSATAAWGAADNLFYALYDTFGSSNTVNPFPTGYANGFNQAGSSSNILLAGARKTSAGDTDDPAAATLSVSQLWHAYTLIVGPSVASDMTLGAAGTATATMLFAGLNDATTKFVRFGTPGSGMGYLAADPALVAGDLGEYDIAAGGYALSIAADGSWEIAGSPAEGRYVFNYRVWDAADGSAGPWAPQTVLIRTPPAITGIAGAISGAGRFYDGEVVTITGTAFGAVEGRVAVGSTQQTITSWADTEIVFTASVPDEATYDVFVVKGG